MKSRIMAGLLAAAAMLPGVASAQDGGGWRTRGNAPTVEQRAERQAERRAERQAERRVERQASRGGAQAQVDTRSGRWRVRDGAAVQQRRDENFVPQNVQRRDRAVDIDQRRDQRRAEFYRQREQRQAIAQDRRDDRRPGYYDRRPDRQDAQRYWRDRQGWDDRGWEARRWQQYRGQQNRWQQQGWDRNEWRRDRAYDWQRYRSYNRGLYRLPRYYAPNDWYGGYRAFGIGALLTRSLFRENYWIGDPWYYRLPPVDGPYRWVRYYNDALLVDIYSGEVVDVVQGIFW